MFSQKLGTGDNFLFWFDHWLDGKSIVDRFSQICIKDSDIPYKSRVAYVWRRGAWYLPDPTDTLMQEAWDLVRKIVCTDEQDQIS